MVLTTWWVRAVIIALAASAVLNLSSYLPWLKDIKPARIRARWVGYVGLSSAFALWALLNPEATAWTAFKAWVVIAVTTLLPNTLIHWRAESMSGGKSANNGRLPHVIVVSADELEDLIGHLTGHSGDLTVALLAIEQAALKARRLAAMAPDQAGAQVWAQMMRDPLETAFNRVKEIRDEFESTHRQAINYRLAIEELANQWRQGLIVKAA